MLKIAPDAATEEEKNAGGVTKQRYLRFRDEISSTATLGFRIDYVALPMAWMVKTITAGDIPAIDITLD